MRAFAFLALAAGCTCALAQQVVFFNGIDPGVSQLDAGSLSGQLATVMGLPSPKAPGAQPPVHGNAFDRPEALLSLHLHGVGVEDTAGLLAPGAAQQPIQLLGKGSAESVTAVVRAARAAGAAFKLQNLEQGALQGCGPACLEEALTEALQAINASYSRGTGGPLGGSVTWQAPAGADQAAMALDSPAARLWAVEVASLYRAGADAASEALRRQQQWGASAAAPTLLAATLVSPAALAAHAQGGSAQAAAQALAGVAGVVQQRLSQAYGGRLVTHLTLEASSGAGAGSIQRLISQRTAHQRRRLAAVRPAVPTAISTAWLVQALAWSSSVLILLFILGVIYVMCNMPFKEDSLLYARPKVE